MVTRWKLTNLCNAPKFIRVIIVDANNIQEKVSVKKLDKDIFQLTVNRAKYRVNVSDLSCECRTYHDRSTCEHLVFISHHLGLSLGYYKPASKFETLKKRGRPRLAKNALKKN
ncbi:hypothetical protein BpHYR1_005366 [Brachionus plicatilis]|uniref:SWIM-type domain-containing protein n=1 Tax=Brachionus plicatilis TaxID=10195 RepID=A0A3M7RJ45_BRAPC|nr:hypothetical protein BpHYR1_005366 [Brachionus plicatilis]